LAREPLNFSSVVIAWAVYDFLMASRTEAYPRVLYLIGAFKLAKGLVLLAVGIGALKLLDRQTAAKVYQWANAIRADPGNRYIHKLLGRFSTLNEKTLRELGVGTFFYSGLLLTEGAGLLLRKHWAEYFTLIVTSSFIPLEVYEIVRRASFAKGFVLVLNVAVVVYLVSSQYTLTVTPVPT
jgi:uncharacterized membrane protein (DUF2068 family)